MKYHWEVLSSLPDQVEELSAQLGVIPLVAHLLLQRGLEDPDKARDFLQPDLKNLHDPSLMKDMDLVVERVFRAAQIGEKILIYGDYDVDGIMATVILKRALEMLGKIISASTAPINNFEVIRILLIFDSLYLPIAFTISVQ